MALYTYEQPHHKVPKTMPYAPSPPCRTPGCPGLSPDGSGFCPPCKQANSKAYDATRRNSKVRKLTLKFANSRRRRHYLKRNPVCVECERSHFVAPATVVDHITPHRGDPALCWDRENWQSLCKICHDRKTATETGFKRVYDHGGVAL